ncbi:hypothetical protein QQ045_012516 [Rhodiola kirilowii]
MAIISQVLAAFSVALVVLALPVYGQPGLPCTPAMVNNFTPCMNFLNNATANTTTPTPDCCNSLKSVATNSSGCLCLLVSGNVPFPVTVNRTSAISLPQACNMPGVAVQCKASTTAPAPAPGPASLAQSPSPAAAASPAAPASPVAPTPASDTPQAVPSPASSTTPPTSTTPSGSGGAASPSPSSAIPPASSSFSIVVLGLGMLFMICS